MYSAGKTTTQAARHLTGAAAFLVVLAACTGTGAESQSEEITTSTLPQTSTSTPAQTSTLATTTTTTTGPPPDLRTAPGRLAITDAAGRVALINPDGTQMRRLTVTGSDSYFQPIWSPDGKLLAAGHTRGQATALALIDVASGEIDLASSADTPFYAYWSPTGESIAFLNNSGGGGLDLTLVDVGSKSVSPFGQGAPFYFSWSPDGQSLATHIGPDAMSIRTLQGETTVLDPPGIFQAPQWTAAGVLHVAVSGPDQQLVLTKDDVARSLALVRGRVIFSANRDGSKVAVVAYSQQEGLSALAQRSSQPAPLLPANRLVVLDTATLEWEDVAVGQVAGFFWSPDGARLLALDGGDQELAVKWNVWQEGVVTAFDEFVPSPEFVRNVLPFFDQYAQSLNLWSPDSEWFTYPAATGGNPGVWVQRVSGGPPTRVADGSWVAWSNN